MNIWRMAPALIVAAVLGSPSALTAQSARPNWVPAAGTAAPAHPHVSYADQQFVLNTLQRGAEELDMATLGRRHASLPEVRTLASQIARDHAKLNAELRSLAHTKSILSIVYSTLYASDLGRLSNFSGRDFDLAYLDAQIADTSTTVALFEQEARAGDDPDLKAFAANALPALRAHLTAANALQPKVAAPAAR